MRFNFFPAETCFSVFHFHKILLIVSQNFFENNPENFLSARTILSNLFETNYHYCLDKVGHFAFYEPYLSNTSRLIL